MARRNQMRKLAREAVIFMLSGMLLSAVTVFSIFCMTVLQKYTLKWKD